MMFIFLINDKNYVLSLHVEEVTTLTTKILQNIK